jgi:hypothetical protein
MLDIKGVEKVMDKLKGKDDPGEFEKTEKGRAEIRYSYYLQGKMVFTFGLTRGSSAKSKKFYYVPRQMLISREEYENLHNCPWSKKDYNNKISNL